VARAAAAAVLLTAGCASPRTPPHPDREMAMRVEAYLFSGRPNPSFTLDAGQNCAIAALLRALPSGGEPREPPGLGYRGFVIRDAGAALPGCAELRAFQGVITANCGDERRVLSDPGRTVERRLMELGRAHLEPGVYEAIQSDLGQP